MVNRGWLWAGKLKDLHQRIEISPYKMNKFQRTKVQLVEDSVQYCIKYLKVSKRVSLKCSHHHQTAQQQQKSNYMR